LRFQPVLRSNKRAEGGGVLKGGYASQLYFHVFGDGREKKGKEVSRKGDSSARLFYSFTLCGPSPYTGGGEGGGEEALEEGKEGEEKHRKLVFLFTTTSAPRSPGERRKKKGFK